MALSKCKIGELVTLVDERNNIGLREFYGLNIHKEFMPTVANTDTLDETKYKVVRKNRFVYSGMQTGRDECIRISMYKGDTPIIVSPAYLTCEVTATDKIIPEYFFMLFLSPEKDRLGWFRSDGSIRSNLDWPVFCDFDIELPPIEVQQKYVDIYQGMVNNQKAYERGLEDLKLVCDGYIEDLRRKLPSEPIGKYLSLSDRRNDIGLGLEAVRGISTSKEFIETKADMEGVGLANYKLVQPNYFAYVGDTSRRGDKISLALNTTNETFLVSSISYVFTTSIDLLAEYLMLFFSRDEFNRYARFNSWGSARESFNFDDMCNVKIPIPAIEVQKSIADIFKVYNTRKRINEQLKAQIKDICPILIKGSIDEARR